MYGYCWYYYIIIEELHDRVTNLFQKKDKRDGYLLKKELKDIVENELKIDFWKMKVVILVFFFSFVTSDKKVHNSDIE